MSYDEDDDLPYARGSETSKAAAESAAKSAADGEARVLRYITERGEQGATDQETHTATGIQLSTVQARRIGLRKKGMVRDSGLTRSTSSGRKATVWVIGADAGNQEAGASKRVNRPNPQEIAVALTSIKHLAEHSKVSLGPAIPEELRKLWRWLEWISRQ